MFARPLHSLIPVFPAAIFAGFLVSAAALAEPLVIKLDVKATSLLEESVDLSDGIDVDLWLTSPSGSVVHSDGMKLTSDRNGALYGDRKLSEAPDAATNLCFRFSAQEIQSALLLFETCEPISLSGSGHRQYRTKRSIMTPAEYYRLKRNAIIDQVDNRTSSDKALFEVDQRIYDFFSETPQSALAVNEARLISHLIAVSLKIRTRVPTTDYFEIGNGLDNGIIPKIELMIASDRSAKNNTNSAKVLFQAFQRIDLDRYSAGRPDFLPRFFNALEFLALERARIARENGISGATVAREFATYCKDLELPDAKALCAEIIEQNSDVLFAEATAAGPASSMEDLSIAARYHAESLLQVSEVEYSSGNAMAAVDGVNRVERFLATHEESINPGTKGTIQKITAGAFR